MVALLLVLCSLGFYLVCIILTNHNSFFDSSTIDGILFVCLLALFALCISKIIKSERSAIVFLSVLSLSILLLLNFFVKPVPVSDYEVLWNGARQIVDGTFQERAMLKDDYYCFYNFQIGYAFYLSILYRVFHGSIMAMRIIECLVMTLTNIVLYKTFRLFQGIRWSLIGTTLFACFPFLILGSGILNNQHEAMLFEALAIYVYLKNAGKKSSWYFGIVIGCFLYIGVFVRPTATVVLIAIVMLSLIQGILKHNKEYLICAGVIVVSYIIISCIINEFFVVSGLAPYGLNNHNIWFKLVLGLTGAGITQQPTTDAEHTNLYYDLKYYGFDYDAYKNAASYYLQSLFITNSFDVGFITDKIVSFCGSYDNQYVFAGSTFYSDHQIITTLLNTMGLCLYFATIVFSSIRCLIKRILDYDEIALPALIFVGFFVSYILFEAQTRYRYEQYYMLFLLAIPAMSCCWCKIRTLFSRTHEKNHVLTSGQ